MRENVPEVISGSSSHSGRNLRDVLSRAKYVEY